MRKRKITLVCGNIYGFGGGVRWTMEVYKRLRKKYDVTILNITCPMDDIRFSRKELFRQYDLEGDVIDIDCFAVRASVPGAYSFPLFIPKNMPRLIKLLGKADIIYSENPNPLISVAEVLASKIYKRKLVYGVFSPLIGKVFSIREDAGLVDKAYLTASRFLVRNFKHIHVFSKEDYDTMHRNFPEARIYLIPNFTYFSPSKITSSPRFNALFMGRLEKYQKGLDILSDALDMIINEEKQFNLTIAGAKGDGEYIVRDIVKRFPNNVKWKGFLWGKELERTFSDANLLMFPSRLETLPLSITEAKTFGIPVVAFDVRGPKQLVKNGVEGRLVKPFDTRVFADAVLSYFGSWKKNRAAYSKMKEKIARAAAQDYDPEATIRNIESMLKD